MSKEKTKRTEISVLYNLPENWAEETAFSFSPIASEKSLAKSPTVSDKTLRWEYFYALAKAKKWWNMPSREWTATCLCPPTCFRCQIKRHYRTFC